MALLDLWNANRAQLIDKQIQQVIAFAGGGKLGDDTTASLELRAFLREVPSESLDAYAKQCLTCSFQDSGFALQDVVNEVGRRIGYVVEHGRYRGTASKAGHDGIWTDPGGHSLVVEVKTTDAYRIDLDRIAAYRQELVRAVKISPDQSSMLLVVGRQDTGDLEAQIRGSRYAWDTRVISVEALLSILRLKEDVEDPSIVKRIHQILIPHEFTRLDQIVEIAFAAVEDVKQEIVEQEQGIARDTTDPPPSELRAHCIDKIERTLQITLVKQSRGTFASPDSSVRLVCLVSRFHKRTKHYWFSFSNHHDDYLSDSRTAYVAFGCAGAKHLFLVSHREFQPWLASMGVTDFPGRKFWHVRIRELGDSWTIIGKPGSKSISIDKYMLR